MAGFFGPTVLPTYNGPSAQQSIEDVADAQKTAFDQQRQHMMDVQQGRDSGQDTSGQYGLAGKIPGVVRSLFGSGNSGSDPTQAGTSAWGDTMNAVGDAAARSAAPALDAASGAPPAGGLMRTYASGAPTTAPTAPTDQSGTGGMFTPPAGGGAGAAAPKMGAGPDGAPMAGEFVPSIGRFATTQDGQEYHQLAQQAASGIPPQGLMATRGSQGNQGNQIGPWASGYGLRGPGGGPPLAAQPTGTVTRTPGTPSTPIQPPAMASAPPAAIRAPAPAPTLPAGSAPAQAAPQLLNAQAAMQPTMQPAMQSAGPPQPPSVPQFLANNGVAPEVSRPGLGTVNRAVPLLPNAYDALAKANLEGYTQGQETNRTVLSEAGAGARAQGEEATQRDIAQSGQANQRDIAALDRTTQTNIALLNAKVRERELDAEVQKMGIMFGFQQNAQVQKGMDDIVKGAQASEDAVTHTTDAMRVLQLAAKDKSLGSAAKLRAYMAENGLDSQRMSAQIEEISDRELDPSVKGRLQGFLSGATDGVPPADQIAAGVAALGQVRAAAYQTYDQRLRAGALQHTEIPDALQRISVRESTLAPDLFRQGVGSGGGGGTGPMQPPRGAGTGGLAGGNSDQGSLRPVTQGQWKQLQQKFPQQDLTKYYRVVGQ